MHTYIHTYIRTYIRTYIHTVSYLQKCDRSLLRNETAILLQDSTKVNKMRQAFYYKMRLFYYKIRQLLQCGDFITKCDV